MQHQSLGTSVFSRNLGAVANRRSMCPSSRGEGSASSILPCHALILAKVGKITFGRAVQMAGGQAALQGGGIEALNAPLLIRGGALVGNGTLYATVVKPGREDHPGGIRANG